MFCVYSLLLLYKDNDFGQAAPSLRQKAKDFCQKTKDKKRIVRIATDLDWNHHRSMHTSGNNDFTVLMRASGNILLPYDLLSWEIFNLLI